MKITFRVILLTGLFNFGLLTGLHAQDNYEYAVVQLVEGVTFVTTSTNAQSFKSSKKDMTAISEGLKKVEELTSEGWEVYSSTVTNLQGIVYFLRKKKPQ